MNAIIIDKLDDLRALCEKHHVRELYLVGSATRDDFDPQRSDLDFLVEFQPLPVGERSRHFFALQADLEGLFGRPVDLGEPEGIRNRIVRERVEQSKVPIYAAA
jgi:uncharacterized protein